MCVCVLSLWTLPHVPCGIRSVPLFHRFLLVLDKLKSSVKPESDSLWDWLLFMIVACVLLWVVEAFRFIDWYCGYHKNAIPSTYFEIKWAALLHLCLHSAVPFSYTSLGQTKKSVRFLLDRPIQCYMVCLIVSFTRSCSHSYTPTKDVEVSGIRVNLRWHIM